MTTIHSGYLKTKNGVQLMSTNPYPIGAIYLSVDATDPSKLFGGEWVQIKDVFLLACGDTYTNGTTGGEANHTLTVNELPNHQHTLLNLNNSGYTVSWTSYSAVAYDGKGFPSNIKTSFEGGGQAHNNMPPYLVVYMWKRIA